MLVNHFNFAGLKFHTLAKKKHSRVVLNLHILQNIVITLFQFCPRVLDKMRTKLTTPNMNDFSVIISINMQFVQFGG